MAQSNEQGGDVPTGLDEAVRMFAGYVRGENGFDELDFKEWLIEWHNKQVEAELEALREEVKHEDLRTISQVITARIDKLKESSNA